MSSCLETHMVTMRAKQVLIHLCLLECFLHFLPADVTASEFVMDGDFVIGGLFDIHHVNGMPFHDRPETIPCASQPFILSSYRRFQLMRFSVEKINNSTNLLPNVTLGYNIFDHCSNTQNFPGILNLISVNGSLQPWINVNLNFSKMIAAVGTYTSKDTQTIAPLFMMNLIPMVSYGAASSVFSNKKNFPSFLRTVHPNKDVIEVVFNILQKFNWRWVSFLYSDDPYGTDGMALFVNKIKDSNICLAYAKALNVDTDYPQVLRQLDAQNVNVIIVFAAEWTAEVLVSAAIEQNVTNKVWIAGDAWSLNTQLPKEKGIQKVGTVLGVAQPSMTIPGFVEFLRSFEAQSQNENAEQEKFCNQNCGCNVTAEDIINADPSFNFPVYSAVYAIAHALHNVLQCDDSSCNRNISVPPYVVLSALWKSNFTILNQTVEFDENGDPHFGTYSVVFWARSGDAEEVGSYNFNSRQFYINSTKIQWHGKGEVPLSFCSPECPSGYVKVQQGIHKCCFSCTICANGTYVNATEDPYKCITCKETEWSADGSTSCNQRLVEFVPFTDGGAIVIVVGVWTLVGLNLAMSVLFAVNYNTPVVKSAGGPMCFLILVCLSLCSVSVFFYFDKPTTASCILRFLPFLLFFTVCLACFVVRSFQIVCIFKIAAKLPKLLSWWMKYNGQWLIIAVAFATQALLLTIGFSVAPQRPVNDTVSNSEAIILGCDNILKSVTAPVILLSSLCILCFIFSYMGKDLPKNYNEAKAITFCLLLLILTWITLATASILYHGVYIYTFMALAVLSSLYSFLLWYFLPKCYIIIFQPEKNTQQHFQGLIQNYTKAAGQ